jgi:hypothetical protein
MMNYQPKLCLFDENGGLRKNKKCYYYTILAKLEKLGKIIN